MAEKQGQTLTKFKKNAIAAHSSLVYQIRVEPELF